jgi:hypothetical protein
VNRTVIPSLALGWAGSVASWLAAAHPILSLLATVLAAVASVYAIVVSRRTARLRRLEIEATTQRLCERCRAGYPPAACPLLARPDDCPLNHRKP